MKIYIDKDYRCHSVNDGSMREYELPFFEGKCAAFIQGYRYVPEGETWTRSDGEVFTGEMISPAVDNRILEAYQKQYEQMLPELSDAEAALELMGVRVDE